MPALRGRPAEANAGRAKKAVSRVYCSGKPDPKKMRKYGDLEIFKWLS
ncbi:MAG: hypothetical protein Q4G08_08350 [Capnocytophaga sp.]|nr:hypothetical protein [Capnocytophaga sp.]